MEQTRFNRSTWSWILYDMANTAFSMGVVSMFFGLWIRSAQGAENADWIYGWIQAFVMGFVFVLAPLMGAWSDYAGKKNRFLLISTLSCILSTLLLDRFGYLPTLIFFSLALASYHFGLQFYDSLLPTVSSTHNRGRVSGVGVGLGYLGSLFPVSLSMALPKHSYSFYFFWIAVFFLVFSIPCLLWVKDTKHNPFFSFGFRKIRSSLARTKTALLNVEKFPGLLRFLIGRVFYTDAINTVIAMMSLFAVNVAVQSGFSDVASKQEVSKVMFLAILFAVPGGILWGRLVDRFDPKRVLLWVLWLWKGTLILAFLLGFFSLRHEVLYLVGILAGLGMGGAWTADRTWMLNLTPADRVGEFYGLYGMVSRFAAMIGPAIWGIITYVFIQLDFKPVQAQSLAILSLFGFVEVSYQILRKVPRHGG